MLVNARDQLLVNTCGQCFKIDCSAEAVAAAAAYLVSPVATEDLAATPHSAQTYPIATEDIAVTTDPVQIDPATNNTAPPVSSTEPIAECWD